MTNGSAPHHPRMDSIRSDSPHTPGSPPGPLKTMTSAPQPGGHLDDSSSNDTTLLSAEVKQLRSQLQIATEKWARDKQMFAEVRLLTWTHAHIVRMKPFHEAYLTLLFRFGLFLCGIASQSASGSSTLFQCMWQHFYP